MLPLRSGVVEIKKQHKTDEWNYLRNGGSPVSRMQATTPAAHVSTL